MQNACLITIDVEEWFQVENLRSAFPKNTWKNQKSTVTKNTRKILNILNDYNIKGTFFILGLVAETNPELVKLISEHGHEIASHGTGHDLTYNLDDHQLLDDINNSKTKLEKLIGSKVSGYRAPNFSVSEKLIAVLKKLDFQYDTSYNPFQLNNRYGKIYIDPSNNYGIYNLDDNFFEVPLSSLKIYKQHIPMAGGAYFRIYPFPIFKYLVKTKLKLNNLYHFYLHPWEFEPEQPRIKNIKWNYRVRHYTGLKNTEAKFERLLQFLKGLDCQFMTISEYLNTVKKRKI